MKKCLILMKLSDHCHSCGRPFGDFKKLKDNPSMKYCSKLCRKEKLEVRNKTLELYILNKLHQVQSNICPSQISRDFYRNEWRKHHQSTIKACRRLYLSKEIIITQRKSEIRSLNFRGPFRISVKK